MDRLYIMVPNMIFYWFLKNSKFHSKSMCYPTVLTKIASLGHKVTETLYLLVLTPIFEICWVLKKNQIFAQNREMFAYGFT
jgi:hypothetical protein